MNRTPFTVRKDCAASRAHQAFIALGLRHLLVVDSGNNVVGMITRKDLDHAAGAERRGIAELSFLRCLCLCVRYCVVLQSHVHLSAGALKL